MKKHLKMYLIVALVIYAVVASIYAVIIRATASQASLNTVYTKVVPRLDVIAGLSLPYYEHWIKDEDFPVEFNEHLEKLSDALSIVSANTAELDGIVPRTVSVEVHKFNIILENEYIPLSKKLLDSDAEMSEGQKKKIINFSKQLVEAGFSSRSTIDNRSNYVRSWKDFEKKLRLVLANYE